MKSVFKVLMLVSMLIAEPLSGAASASVNYDYTIDFNDGVSYMGVADYYRESTGVEFSSGWIFGGGSNKYSIALPESIGENVVGSVITFNKPVTDVSFSYRGDSVMILRDEYGVKADDYHATASFDSGNIYFSSLACGLKSIFTIEIASMNGLVIVDDLSLKVAPTPIPGTLWMLISGMLGLLGVRRFV
ncbi:hypothetical protein N1030_01140 [Desulfovibrio mangrovi]|uniref:hypothetical protein n=1 Tax=Desulfovibrio mangrovi TaxID=2976983 RepID=UPI002246F06B|nr:hypothetical protein [Desulfovibrio mangrovi]UZP67602.1 hypothetical protein N1030_01140 [Desulfovibrio mangrovi]